jgi:uncharacterized protein (DUF1697 family)
MTSYIALLRGVNVGGNKMVPMADLRAMLVKMGLTGAKTLLQSGNAVFAAKTQPPAKLEQLLETETKKRFGFSCDYHVRTADELDAVIAANPLAEYASDPSRLLVTFFRAPLDTAAVKAAQAAIDGPEIVRADGRHLYMYYPNGQANSKAAIVVGKALRVQGTGRNWNTVLKLAALARQA